MGKSTIASQLAQHYKVHHIHVKDVITQAIENMNKLAKKAEAEADKPGGEGEEEEEEEEEEQEEEQPDLAELEAINENMEGNNGRLDDQYVIKFFRQRLLSKPCQNQGYILDGFPKTREQAITLFERRNSFLYYILQFLKNIGNPTPRSSCHTKDVYRYLDFPDFIFL